MFFRKCEPTNLEHISDTYSLDWKFGANSVADGYRAYDKVNKRHCSLWITREPLSDELRARFFEHIRDLRKGGLERISKYGCDIDGIGYVALPVLAAKRLDYDAPAAAVKARRFLLAILKVEAFHLQGIICGNLCTDSFMLDSEEQLHFVGYAGGSLEKQSIELAREYQTFIPSEVLETDQVSQGADVYALAVIGLKLFGATFPAGEIDRAELPAYLKTLDPKAPLWLHAVLPRVLSCKPEQRYKDASQLLAAISLQLESQRQLTAEHQDSDTSSHDLKEEAQIVRSLLRGFIRRQAKIRKLLQSPIFVITSACAIMGMLIGISWVIGTTLSRKSHGVSDNEKAGLLSSGGILLDAREYGGQGSSMTTTLGKGLRSLLGKEEYKPDDLNLGMLKGAEGVAEPSGQQVALSAQAAGTGVVTTELPASSDNTVSSALTRPSVRWTAQLARAQQAGFSHAVEVLGYLVNTPHTIHPSDIDSLLNVLTPNLTKEERRDLVLSYERVDADLSYMLAAALTLDLADPVLFRELLARAAQKQIGVNRSAEDQISTLAFMSAIPSAREFFLDDVATDASALSKDDVWWVLETLIAQRAEQLQYFARSDRMNQLIDGPRRLYLKGIAQAVDLQGVPIAALLKSARSSPDVADVQQFAQWYDPASVQILLTTLLVSSEPQVLSSALDSLATKSTENSSLDAALAYVNSNLTSLRVYYARFIGGVGLVNSLSVEERRAAFSTIAGKPQTSQLCKIMLQKGDAALATAILDRFGQAMNPVLLVDLLKHPDKGVRLQIIPYVKSVSLSSSWQQVVDAYLTEADAEVKARYESEIPRIRGS